jgi:hypothetical protein
VLYPLLYKLPHTVMHYLNDIIFPEVLAHQVHRQFRYCPRALLIS